MAQRMKKAKLAMVRENDPLLQQQLEHREDMDSVRAAVTEMDRRYEAKIRQYTKDLPDTADALLESAKLLLGQIQVAEAGEQLYGQVKGMCYIQLGKILLKLKADIEHGKWGATLEDLRISERRASNYMRIARQCGEISNKGFGLLGYRQLSALCEVPHEEINADGEIATIFGEPVDKLNTMSGAEIREWAREHEKKGMSQLERVEKKFRAAEEENRRLKIGPETDIAFMDEGYYLDRVLTVWVQLLAQWFGNATSSMQRDFAAKIIIGFRKTVKQLTINLQEQLDPLGMLEESEGKEPEDSRPDIVLTKELIELMENMTAEARRKGELLRNSAEEFLDLCKRDGQ
ncbi:MAG: hypothetical protein C4532_11835 [Candidatus Abyssobacteria bacterium SURF_17]|jgi:hypothetical protein|uniref:DUF3102 domain-containing protein n=1 Tax=Candidatus Abyssobacteria bacterium SURF_17 TaxID=2093361 RepID=A0A419EWN5_9BACT|nr:MAG: hypothetical protein C4532_11835 [Candidatus Abyssubacteria bacterium SURF_17]